MGAYVYQPWNARVSPIKNNTLLEPFGCFSICTTMNPVCGIPNNQVSLLGHTDKSLPFRRQWMDSIMSCISRWKSHWTAHRPGSREHVLCLRTWAKSTQPKQRLCVYWIWNVPSEASVINILWSGQCPLLSGQKLRMEEKVKGKKRKQRTPASLTNATHTCILQKLESTKDCEWYWCQDIVSRR